MDIHEDNLAASRAMDEHTVDQSHQNRVSPTALDSNDGNISRRENSMNHNKPRRVSELLSAPSEDNRHLINSDSDSQHISHISTTHQAVTGHPDALLTITSLEPTTTDPTVAQDPQHDYSPPAHAQVSSSYEPQPPKQPHLEKPQTGKVHHQAEQIMFPGEPQSMAFSQTDRSPDLASQISQTAPPLPYPNTGSITTQIAPAMQPDLDITDEGYAESTSTSYVTSIASEISRGILENERLYPQYGQHNYGMPIDEEEMDRMDLQHRKYELVIGDRHFLAPIGDSPHRILDLGTGTGIWALDVADMFPGAEVIGVDIAPIQPKWVAPNCQFEIDDIEDTWTYRPNSFDFIHLRDPLYVVRDWPKLMAQCYTHTKPGGYVELACIYPVPQCDDNTMPSDSGFKLVCDKFIEASRLFGTPADCPLRFAEYLRTAGFVDVRENIFKVPSSPWPKDKRLKMIGALEMTNVVAGATAFGLRVFEQVFGWSRERTEVAMIDFRRDVKRRDYHQYCQYFIVYGRKSPDSSNYEI